jgi:uncharacterized damage-inducible protein DinB
MKESGAQELAFGILAILAFLAFLAISHELSGGRVMKVTELFLAEIDREAERCKRALAQVPEGKRDWKPHEKSMPFGYLSDMVATMPGWAAMAITQDELDLNPPGGSKYKQEPMNTSADLLEGLQKSVAQARDALQGTTDEFLTTPWRLLVGGKVVMEAPRHVVLRDMLNHLAHHRGQMTVYLRLLGATVPALYGPSADDKRFDY